MDIEKKLEELVNRHLPDNQYFVTEIKAKQAGGNTRIAVFIDGDRGVDIGICALINKKVGQDLEDQNLLSSPYTLEVSSPGLDKPLKMSRQYHKNMGKEIRIQLDDSKQIEGTLAAVADEYIIIKQKLKAKDGIKELTIPFAEIVTTHVLVSF